LPWRRLSASSLDRKIWLLHVTNLVILHRLNWSGQFQQMSGFCAKFVKTGQAKYRLAALETALKLFLGTSEISPFWRRNDDFQKAVMPGTL
jgi:hypothetical protein